MNTYWAKNFLAMPQTGTLITFYNEMACFSMLKSSSHNEQAHTERKFEDRCFPPSRRARWMGKGQPTSLLNFVQVKLPKKRTATFTVSTLHNSRETWPYPPAIKKKIQFHHHRHPPPPLVYKANVGPFPALKIRRLSALFALPSR